MFANCDVLSVRVSFPFRWSLDSPEIRSRPYLQFRGPAKLHPFGYLPSHASLNLKTAQVDWETGRVCLKKERVQVVRIAHNDLRL